MRGPGVLVKGTRGRWRGVGEGWKREGGRIEGRKGRSIALLCFALRCGAVVCIL